MRARLGTGADAASIAAIYSRGIEERGATFETSPSTADEVRGWFRGDHPVVVVETEEEEHVVAFGRASGYSARSWYAGVYEVEVYVDPAYRRRGAGALALDEIVIRAQVAGAWKLVSRLFVENAASRALFQRLGFREVGVYQRHARLDGAWRDVVIVEKLLDPSVGDTVVLAAPSSREELDAGEPPTPRALLPQPVEPVDEPSLDAVTMEIEAVTVEIHALVGSNVSDAIADLESAPTIASLGDLESGSLPAPTSEPVKKRRRAARRTRSKR
jgi:phosphinothricin acetyltransferase